MTTQPGNGEERARGGGSPGGVRTAGHLAGRSIRRTVLTVAAPLVALGLLVTFPDVAHACPVCFDRDDEARIAFLATTGLLTLLPLGLVLGTGMWLRRRARELAEEEREE